MVTKKPQSELCSGFVSCNACAMIDKIYSFPSEESIFSVLLHMPVLEKAEHSRAGTEPDVSERQTEKP
jgi:hypothetical protein